MDELRQHIDKRLDELHNDLRTIENKLGTHREEYLREVTEMKTKVDIFKSWMTGAAAFIGAAVSALINWINHS
jgi:hypothetical protein